MPENWAVPSLLCETSSVSWGTQRKKKNTKKQNKQKSQKDTSPLFITSEECQDSGNSIKLSASSSKYGALNNPRKSA